MPGLPALIFLLVLSLLLALGLFAWGLVRLVRGPRAVLKRRVAQIAGAAMGAGREAAPRRRKLRIGQEDGKGRAWAASLREQLRQAGIGWEVRRYLLVNAGLALFAALVALILGLPPIGLVLAAAIVGFGLPKMAVSFMAKRRIGRFTARFAEALDVIVRGIRSGLPLGECINIIGRDMPDPLGVEFRLIAEDQRLGLTLQEALDRAVERMPTADFKYFAIVLAIQQQTGGNLAETLSKLADVLRGRKRLRDKIKACSSEATASASIIGSLPIVVAGLLFLIGRDYVMILFTNPTGHLLIGIGCVLMLIGALVMRKMINFDV